MKQKKILITFLGMLVFVLSLGIVSAVEVSIDNYYPTPVEAGEYLNVWLKVSNPGSADVENAVVKLMPTFPFSLDPGEPEEIIISHIKTGGFVIEKMKIKVDGSAVEGENLISFQYADYINGEWKKKTIPITVVESQTTFDVVLQELTGEGVFIAIANIGKNPANAVTVRIPEQEDFRPKLVSASIVGNLASGDYTIVGFEIVPKKNIKDFSKEEDMSKIRQQVNLEELQDFVVQIDYTDPLGIRRSVFKTIALNPDSLNLISSGMDTDSLKANMKAGKMNRTGGFLSNSWFWVSVVLLAIMIGRAVFNRRKKS